MTTTARPARRNRRRPPTLTAAPDVDQAIDVAERSAVVIWRGERLAYAAIPGRIAHVSRRGERDGLFTRYLEAVEAINPLREGRLARLTEAARAAGHPDLVAAAPVMASYDPDALSRALQLLLVESETVYFAALRRYLALIDIEQGDATLADLWHIQEGTGWNQWFDIRRTAVALEGTRAAPGSVSPGGAGSIGFSPWSITAARLRMLGGGQDGADAIGKSAAAGLAALFDALLTEPAWLGGELGMPEAEVVGFADFAAFNRLWRLRRDTALLGYELRLHRTDDAFLRRAYFSGLVGLMTGIVVPEPLYLAQVGRVWEAGARARAELLAGMLAENLRARHGPAWWRDASAHDELHGIASASSLEDAVARLGYDHLDWRPVLRQIRTQLIGEMSGYGGPNITTRAGTRKV